MKRKYTTSQKKSKKTCTKRKFLSLEKAKNKKHKQNSNFGKLSQNQKRTREQTICNRIIDFMMENHLFLTKNQFHIYNEPKKSYQLLKHFVATFSKHFQGKYLEENQICFDLKKEVNIPRTIFFKRKLFF